MRISDLKEMETIVSSCSSLKWDGWNVLFLEEDPTAYMDKNAVFHQEKWHKKTVFSFDDGYWHIPKKILRNKCA